MALVATASKTVRNKNLILILMCAVFALWFNYDAWKGYPEKNDALIRRRIALLDQEPLTARNEAYDKYVKALQAWPGWQSASSDQRAQVGNLLKANNHDEGWHSDVDILMQCILAIGLIAGTLAAGWWFVHCQKRRAVADDQHLSPEPGLQIPWSQITKIDNSRWKKTGIVDLEYKDGSGQTCTTKLDDYLLDNLRPILNELLDRAPNAQFIPPTSPEGEPAASPQSPDNSKEQSPPPPV